MAAVNSTRSWLPEMLEELVVWFDDEASVTVADLHIAAIEKGIVSVPANGEPGAAPGAAPNGGAATPSDSPDISKGRHL